MFKAIDTDELLQQKIIHLDIYFCSIFNYQWIIIILKMQCSVSNNEIFQLRKYLKLDSKDPMRLKKIELVSGKWLFKIGQSNNCFYLLLSGSLKVTINQVSIKINDSMVLGDFQLVHNLEYRISGAKALTNCSVLVIEAHYYNLVDQQIFTSVFQNIYIKDRLLRYWISKICKPYSFLKNQYFGDQSTLGIITEGSFGIQRPISICNLKNQPFEIRKKVDVCLVNPYELFQGTIRCESSMGKVIIFSNLYLKFLSLNFRQFQDLIALTKQKQQLHFQKVKELKQMFTHKQLILDSFIPKNLAVSLDSRDQIKKDKEFKAKISSSQLSQNADIFDLKDNLNSFLFLQLRKQIKMKLNKYNKSPSKEQKRFSMPPLIKSRISEPISQSNRYRRENLLQIPKQFHDSKFKLKMFFRQKGEFKGGFTNHNRIKTEGDESVKRSPKGYESQQKQFLRIKQS